jgi:hypothetical protein
LDRRVGGHQSCSGQYKNKKTVGCSIHKEWKTTEYITMLDNIIHKEVKSRTINEEMVGPDLGPRMDK